jgi:hypothetical protein
MTPDNPINFAGKFELPYDQWSACEMAQRSNHPFKIVRLNCEFIWHRHPYMGESTSMPLGLASINIACG